VTRCMMMSGTRVKTIWEFNQNHRVYRKPEPGNIWGRGGPIWREHWRAWEVIGETSRSWLIGNKVHPTKVPKVGANPRKWLFSEEDVIRQAWVEDNRYALGQAVQRCCNYDTMQHIARLVGYKETPTDHTTGH
jgi:hypothetical protein